MAGDHITLTIADISGKGYLLGYLQVLDGCRSNLGAFLDFQPHHIGIGQDEALGRERTRINQELEDGVGHLHLLVDDRADIERLAHIEIIGMLDVGDGLSNA